MKQLLSVLLIGLFFLTYAHCIYAQEVSLSLNPASREIVMKPGQSLSIPYTFINHSDPQLIVFKIARIEPQPDGTIALLDKIGQNWIFNLDGDNITLNEPFFLKTGEKKEISLSLLSPQILQEKDYYFSLLAQSQASPTNEGVTTARAQLTVASNVLISVTSDGTLETKPKIVEFRLLSKSSIIQSGVKVPIILTVANQGRHLIHAQGTLTINGLGPKKNIPIASQTILANSQSTLYNTSQGFLFGPYTISTTLNFGPSSSILYGTTHIFVLPSSRIIAFLVLFAIIGTLSMLYIKRR